MDTETIIKLAPELCKKTDAMFYEFLSHPEVTEGLGFDEYYQLSESDLCIQVFNNPDLIHFMVNSSERMLTIAYARGVEIDPLDNFLNTETFNLKEIIREGNRIKLLGVTEYGF